MSFLTRLLFLFFYLIFLSSMASEPCHVSTEAKNLVKVLGKNHYSPAAHAPENNRKALEILFAKLDPLKAILTENDLRNFQQKNYRLNDSIQNDACKLVADCLPFMTQKFASFKKELTDSKVQVLTFNKQDTLFPYDIVFMGLAKSEDERKRRIQKYTKWWFLNRAYSEWDTKGTFTNYIKAHEKSILQEEIRQKECELFLNKRYDPENLTRKISKSVLESIAELYDPHSSYFSGSDLKEFNNRLSAEAGSFGIIFNKNEANHLEVEEVVRGSMAWKKSEVEDGDLVVDIEIDGKKLEDIHCQDIDDLNERIESETGRTMVLSIKKTNGKTQKVTLRKSNIEVADNHIDGCKLIHQKQKTGYLPLPSFFYAGESTSGGSASVVGQELINLQKEGINGLILDLRNNGGGSVKEALDLIGLFIDVGPIGIFNSRNTKPEVIKETIRGTLYAGPLLILVNGQSASASEITASALQDLGRGIVVGNQTFGKASMQIVFPVGPTAKEQGHVKTTIGMLYRTAGFSHQQVGVKPDIYLEGPLDRKMPREKDLPHSLFAPPIQKRVAFPAMTIPNLDSLIAKSGKRWKKLSTPGSKTFILLEPEAFASQMADQEGDTSMAPMNGKSFDVQYSDATLARAKLDPGLLKMTERQKATVLDDPWIGEAFRILSDYHTFEKK